jgi:DNA-binding CsgD family transcriptional regulator
MAPGRETDPVPPVIAATAEAMGATRGDIRKLDRVFSRTQLPMVLLDGERVQVDANRAARLLLRLNLSQLRKLRIDDLTPAEDMPTLHAAWDRLQRFGSVAGLYRSRFADGSELRTVYAGIANVLPGRHLAVFMPADWPEDELGPIDLAGVESPLAGPLTPRELEVLTWVAGGYDLRRIAEELVISPATVRTHLRNALRKLHAHNRPHGVALAMHLGLIDLPPESFSASRPRGSSS